jgi:hypothetical protein
LCYHDKVSMSVGALFGTTLGGFERMSPPAAGPHRAQLARRYRRIAEHVPPSLRESFAFAKRRTEALAMRAAAKAKASALAALRAR